MQYPNIVQARFLSRENRFVATVEMEGKKLCVHVKNTGRCRELLVPGATVYLTRSLRLARKYPYDLVAVEKGGLLVNVDSRAVNQVFTEFLSAGGLIGGVTYIKQEYAYGNSRMDLYFERGEERHLVEIKGVTLEKDGVCRFPDAPTSRGTKHLKELVRAVGEGWHAWICFVVQMEGMHRLEPNATNDPIFAAALREASLLGVQVRANGCRVRPNGLEVVDALPVDLDVQE